MTNAIAPEIEPPGEHDPRDPLARADSLEEQVRRHLEEKIGEEEHPGAEADAEADSPRSLFIVSAAKLTFTRSR